MCFISSIYVFSGFCNEIILEKSTKYSDFHVIDASKMPELYNLQAMDQANLVDKNTKQVIGVIKVSNGDIIFDGNDRSHFLISQLPSDPWIASFGIQACANIIFDTFMDLPYSLSIKSKGLVRFGNAGIKLNKLVEISDASELRIEGDININGILKVENLKKIQILKSGNLNADYFHTIGKIEPNIQNMGIINIKKDMIAHGAWYNNSTGKVIVGEYFGGVFSNFYEDGETTVHGLASIKAKNGRMTNKFSASYGIVTFDGNLDIANTSVFYAQHHLTLSTQSSINLNSKSINLDPKNQLFNNVMSRDLFAKIRNIEKGIYITAKKDIFTADANIKSTNTKAVIRGKNFVQKGGAISSGVFNNNFVAVAADKRTLLQGDISSHFDAFIKAKTTELRGTRQIDGTLFLNAEKVVQRSIDINKVHSLVAQGEDIQLKGKTELDEKGQMSVNATKSFETKDTCKIENGKIAVQCEKAELSGDLRKTSLAVSAKKDVTLKKNLKARLSESQIEAGEIIHETGSNLRVKDANIEKAKSSIIIQKNAKVKAKNNIMKTSNLLGYVRQSGDISVDEAHMVDTGFYVGAFGSTKAKNVKINADWLSLNFLSSLKAETTEIDTLVNLSALSYLNGTRSITINALLANLNVASFFHTNNYMSRSLLNVDYSLSMPNFSTSHLDLTENLSMKLVNTGFTILNYIPGVAPYAGIARLAFDIPTKLYTIATTARSVWNEDRSNFWRPSRLSKILCMGADLGMQGYQLYNSCEKFGEHCSKISESNNQDNKTNNDNTDQQNSLTNNDTINAQDAAQGATSWSIFIGKIAEYKEYIPDIIPGTKTVNALLDYSGGVNLMGNIRTNCMNFKDTSFNICNHKEINAYSGEDRSSGIFKSLKTHTVEDLLFTGDKYSLGEIDAKSDNGKVTVDNTACAASLFGDFTAKGIKVDKQEGSDIRARNIILDSNEQTISNGISHADKVFSATSDGETVEGQSSDVKAGEFANFDGNVHFEKQDESKAAAPVVRRHGNSSTLAGSLDGASEKLITTSGRGLFDAAQVTGDEINTPTQIWGSGFTKDDKPLPIEESGEVILPTNAKINAQVLDLRGQGIKNLDELCEQKGVYSSWHVTDYVKVETDQDFKLTESLKSASESFELITNDLAFANGATWDAPKFLILKSTSDNKVTFEGGNRLQGGVYLELKANGDIEGLLGKKLVKDKHGNIIEVEFKPCIFCGGTGIEYEYTDPETAEKSTRRIAVVVESEKQFTGTGVQYVALADIYSGGKEGLHEFAGSQECKVTKKENKNAKKKKTTIIDTKLALPLYSTPGKLIRNSGGNLTIPPAIYNLGEGSDTIAKGPIEKSSIVGRHNKKVKKTKYWIFKSKKEEQDEVAPPIAIKNLGDQKIRFWAIDENGNRYDVDLTGLVYSGKSGTLQIVGHDATLARQILNNYESKSSNKPFVDLPAAHDLLNLKRISASFGLEHKSGKHNYQTFGPGSIDSDKFEIDLTGDLHQDNGFRISNDSGGYVKIPWGNWYQSGAQLKNSSEQNDASLYARLGPKKAEAGAQFSHVENKGYSWSSSVNSFTNMQFEVNNLVQTAATMDIKDGTGYITKVTSIDKRDKEKSVQYGGSVSYDFISKKVDGSFNFNAENRRTDLHESGVNNNSVDLKIEKVIHVKAPKESNSSFSLDLGTGDSKLQDLDIGIQKNNIGGDLSLGFNKDDKCAMKVDVNSFNMNCDSYDFGVKFDENNVDKVMLSYEEQDIKIKFSLDIQNNSDDNRKELFNTVGKISYSDSENNIHIKDIPIVTGINKEVWQGYKNKFKESKEEILSLLNFEKDKDGDNPEQVETVYPAVELDLSQEKNDSYSKMAEQALKAVISNNLYRLLRVACMPIPWEAKITSTVAGFLPERSIDDVIQSHLRMSEAEDEGDAWRYVEMRAQFESDVNLKVLRDFFTVPQRITDEIFGQLNTTFPSIKPEIARIIEQFTEESKTFFEEATHENSPQQKAIINSLF